MFSYVQRLESFNDWPEKHRNKLAKKLAIAGQFALENEVLSTQCVFCGKRLQDWSITDNPLVEHSQHNNSCPLFELNTKDGRMKLNRFAGLKMERAVKNYLDKLVDKGNNGMINVNLRKTIKEKKYNSSNKMIAVNIKRNISIIFCAACGSIDKEHKCGTEVLKGIQTGENKQFWQRFFEGEYLDLIDKYTDKDVLISKESCDVISYLIKNTKNLYFNETVETVLKRSIDDFIDKFNSELKNIESEILEDINSKTL